MVDNLSEMSKKIYQVITLTDCLNRLVIDLERLVKDYTSCEMNLVSLLKEDDTIDFSKLEIS